MEEAAGKVAGQTGEESYALSSASICPLRLASSAVVVLGHTIRTSQKLPFPDFSPSTELVQVSTVRCQLGALQSPITNAAVLAFGPRASLAA